MGFYYSAHPLAVRLLEPEDELLLVEWLNNPLVLQYYEGRDRPHDLDQVREHFYGEDETVRCIIVYEGQPIGYIQYYVCQEEERVEYGYSPQELIYGMDQFIGEPQYWNRGLGTRLVHMMKSYLTGKLGADRIVMDPQVWNERALRCYERCGFRKVRLMKEHEWHEGHFRDCWLMEYQKAYEGEA
jgi:aminoglycoside 6'-N-acetyltransferase